MRMVRRVLWLLLVFVAISAPAFGNASHKGWPPRDPGMLLMNKLDGSRPLDARPGLDPFDGQDPQYRCDSIHQHSDSCFPRLVAALPAGVTLPLGVTLPQLEAIDPETALELGLGLVVTDAAGHNRLLGGHGDDTIHASPFGDVLWGDYKPSAQTTHQTDHLYGGDGPDFIYPSHGKNVIDAGAGNDVIHALYGHGTIDCGPGRDAVYVPRPRSHYTYKHCEWKRHKTGESAPAWYLKALPWPITDV
jgi:hypothetical protein